MVESLVSAPATRALYQIVGHIFCPAPWQLAKLIFKNVGVCAWPVQFSRLIVGSLVSAPATCAVYRSDGWILGLSCCTCSLPNRLSNLLSLRLRPGS